MLADEGRGRRRVGLIGDPVAHSRSPAIQNAAFAAAGINAVYELWPTPAAELPARIATLRESDIVGANVTVPHKLAVMPLLDEVSDLARRAGAVNTIVNQDGRLLGDNTDVYGFAAALVQVLPEPRGSRALILGAGGAARAVVLALETAGAARIAVANRTAARAAALAASLQPTQLQLIGTDEATLTAVLRETDLLVNATAAGWHAGETPLPLRLLASLPPHAAVVDLTYRDTDLLIAARARDLATLDGLPMLVYQGARAFELWTGRPSPLAVMMEAAAGSPAST